MHFKLHKKGQLSLHKKKSIIYFISQLSSPEYTADNFDKLAKVITDRCSLDAQVPCFNCIKTLPGMTELIISFPNSMTQKAVDISYTTDNKMKVIGVH